MSGCKYGEWLDAEGIEDHASVPAARMARNLPVGATTIKTHRSRLCGCYSVAEAVAPGKTDAGLKGFPKPALDYSEDGGTFTTTPKPATEVEPSEAELFAEYNLDPSHWQIMSIGKSKRQANSGEWFESCRVSFKPRADSRTLTGMTSSEMEEIVQRVTSARTTPREEEGAAFVVPVGDLQCGKIDGGGTPALIERFTRLLTAARDQYATEAASAPTVVIPWLGDSCEGTTSQGGRLATRQDLWVSEQVRLVQRMILLSVELFAPLAERVVIPAVPGNHDEVTRQFSTGGTDSWAIHAASAVADTIAAVNNAGGSMHNVEFLFPQRDKLTVTLDVAGSRITCLHGHQFRGGLAGAEKWAAGHALGRQAEGTADLYLCGHLHHFEVRTVGQGQSIIQIDALDGGSQWFTDRTGSNQPPGLCSLIVKDGAWSSLRRYR